MKKIKVLISYIQDTKAELKNIFSHYKEIEKKKDWQSSILLGKIFENFYTSLETVFLKISQYFENDLQPDKWHKDLLEKMKLKIEGIREPVISKQTYAILYEMLEFRHFYRYYVDLDYDWDKLMLLDDKFKEIQPLIEKDLDNFIAFLEQIIK